MVPGPSFPHAARLLAGRTDLCLGLHVTLNAEWRDARWRPVSATNLVSTLVDANGYFLPTPNDLHQRGFDEDQAMDEIKAQLRKARAAGLNIRYLDEHMGVSWIGSLRSRLALMAQEEGLIDAWSFRSLPPASEPSSDWIENVRRRLEQAESGMYVLVTHPGFDREDMRRFGIQGQPVGQVALERDKERRGLTDPHLLDMLTGFGVRPIRYADAASGSVGRLVT